MDLAAAVTITRSSAWTPWGDTYNQWEAIRRQQSPWAQPLRVSKRPDSQLIRHQAALAEEWCFIMAAITTVGSAHSSKAGGLFDYTLYKASRGHVRRNTWLSLVTRTQQSQLLFEGNMGLMTTVSSGCQLVFHLSQVTVAQWISYCFWHANYCIN